MYGIEGQFLEKLFGGVNVRQVMLMGVIP